MSMSKAGDEANIVVERIRSRNYSSIPADLVQEVLDAQTSSQDSAAIARRIAEAISKYAAKED